MLNQLIVYQKSIAFVNHIYKITRQFPKDEMFGLTSQIRRAAVSIPLNISEGEARKSDPQFSHFLDISIGSAAEVNTCLEIAFNLKYINQPEYTESVNLVQEISKLLYSYQKPIKQRSRS